MRDFTVALSTYSYKNVPRGRIGRRHYPLNLPYVSRISVRLAHMWDEAERINTAKLVQHARGNSYSIYDLIAQFL